MLKNTLNRLLVFGFTMLWPMVSFAQWDEAEQAAEDLRDFIYSVAPIAFVVILLVSVIFNIGKVWGENRDWKSFFISVGLYVVAISVVVGIIGYVASISFR